MTVNWDRWMAENCIRKVTKTNFIYYEGAQLAVPPGYYGMKIDVVRYQDRIELYSHENLLITHPIQPIYTLIGKKESLGRLLRMEQLDIEVSIIPLTINSVMRQ